MLPSDLRSPPTAGPPSSEPLDPKAPAPREPWQAVLGFGVVET